MNQRERPWMRHERWVIVFCAVLVALLVLAAIGYLTGGWDTLTD
jgi:hypothetical protein